MLPTSGSIDRPDRPGRSWVGTRRTSAFGRVQPRHVPRLEQLEDRCLPAAPFIQTGGVVTASADLVRLYRLDGDLADALGGPTLAAHGGTVGANRYTFAANQGLQLDNALFSTTNYSIELVMQYSATSPFWKKFIDFAEKSSDNGLYVSGSTLTLYPGSGGTGTIAAGVDFHVVITRNAATGETKTYLNGVLQQTYTGSVSNIAAPATNTLIFFEDDNATAGTEAQDGSADYIAIYNGPLNGADVTTLYQASSAPGGVTAVTLNEGQSAIVDGTFHDADNNSVTVTASIGSITQSGGGHGTWTWSFLADDGPAQSQTVVVTATDSTGASSATSFSLTVNNVAPTAMLSNAGPAGEGSAPEISFIHQLDPSSADTATLHYAYDFDNDGVFDLGDGTYAGSVADAIVAVPASYLVDGPGSLTVRGRIIDKDGASNETTTSFAITNVDPDVTALDVEFGFVGSAVRLDGVFADAGVADTHHAVIDWGDGSQTTLAEDDPGIDQAANTFTANHVYAAPGTYAVTATLTDDDGGVAVQTTTAVIAAPSGVTLSDGVLYVMGTPERDEVSINKVGKRLLKVHASFLPGNHSATFRLDDVERIVADLRAGNDCLSLSGNLDLPAIVLGGAGRDHLNSGAGPAVLVGDDGDDHLNGGKGRDILIGGRGKDRLVGGPGDDVLIGSATEQDNDLDALAAALEAWNNAPSFAAGAAQVQALLAVMDDGVLDKLTGGSGKNLLLQ